MVKLTSMTGSPSAIYQEAADRGLMEENVNVNVVNPIPKSPKFGFS
jgi:hypothetical protein